MLQLDHMKRIVDACYPTSQGEALELWHNIKPVKFGNSVSWADFTVTPATLATYTVPDDSPYMAILRVECYTTTFDAVAPGFNQFSPPPPGLAAWQFTDLGLTSNDYRIAPQVPIHLLCDTDEYLFARGGYTTALLGTIQPPPDGNPRFIRTLVYGYLLGALIADRIGSNESTYDGDTNET